MNRFFLKIFFWSWLITLPISIAGGYVLYKTIDRFFTYQVWHSPGKTTELDLDAIARYEASQLFSYIRAHIRKSGRKQETTLKSIHLILPDSNLATLEANMPHSGFQYVKGRMLDNGKLKKIKIRYRGDSFYRWAWNKKSIRFKTTKNTLYEDMRWVNLLAPRTIEHLNNFLSYRLATIMGLLAPKTELVRLYLNGSDRGVHILVEQIKENTLRNASLMPGDIYRGEVIGKNRFILSAKGAPNSLFQSVAGWDKVAINNHFPASSLRPLQIFLELIQQSDSPSAQKELSQILDMEAWGTFSAFESLTQSTHTDNIHNWRIYFDPWRGQFVPIVWDTMGWFDPLRGAPIKEEIILNSIMSALFKNQDFIRERENAFNRFFEKEQDKIFLNVVSDAITRMEYEVDTDPYLRPSNPESVKQEMYRLEGLIKKILAARAEPRSEQYIKKYVQAYPDLAMEYKRSYPGGSKKDMEAFGRLHWLNNGQKEKRVLPLATFSQLYAPVAVNTIPEPIIWSGEVTIEGHQILDQPLVIEPGTTINLAPKATVVLKHHLTAIGTREAPIRFISATTDQDPWGAIVLSGRGADGSTLSHCEMSDGSGLKGDLFEYSAMLSIHDVKNVVISDCHFKNNHTVDDMVHTVYADIRFERVRFENALSDALDLDISTASISDSYFEHSGNDAVDLMTTAALITGSVFKNNGDKGISVGENSQLYAVNNQLTGNSIGVESKDRSTAILLNQTFTDNKIALHAYKKNWRYGEGGTIFLAKSVVSGEGVSATAKKRSAIQIFDSYLEVPAKGKRVDTIAVNDDHSRSALHNELLPDLDLVDSRLMDQLENIPADLLEHITPDRRGSAIDG